MKLIKLTFVLFVFFSALTSCTSDNIAEDDSLYITQDTFATGGEGAATVDDVRD